MIKRKAKRLAKAKKLVVKNLTYMRLKSDLEVIEREMNNNLPVEKEQPTGGVISKIITNIATEIANTTRRKNTADLSVEKKVALENLESFEVVNDAKELELAKDEAKLKKFMEKELFKKDPHNIQRIQFALSFMLDSSYEYLRKEESLQKISKLLFDDEGYMNILIMLFEQNYYGIQKKDVEEAQSGMLLGAGIMSLVMGSWLPLGVGGIATVISRIIRKKELKDKFQNLSKDELHAFLAMKLTLVEATRKTMSEDARKELIDDLLKYVSNLRGDAEYEWLVEKVDAPLNKEKIELCNLTLQRLSRVVGI